MKIIIIIPTYNERENITLLTEKLAGVISPNCSVLIIDDNSPDGTALVVKNLQKKYHWLNLVIKPNKNGLGAAYKTGFLWALEQGADYVGEMDADLSHQPEDLPKLLDKINTNSDLIIGSRRVGGGKIIGWSAWRHFTSWSAMTVSRLVLNLKTRDVTAGFRLYSKQALTIIPWQNIKSSGYAWQEELVYLCEKNNLKIAEVPITFVDRKRGQSKLSLKDIIEFFITLLRLRFAKTIK